MQLTEFRTQFFHIGLERRSRQVRRKKEEEKMGENSPCEKNFARLVRPLCANLRDDDGKVGRERKEEEASAKKKREEKCNRSEHEAGNPKKTTFVFLRPASTLLHIWSQFCIWSSGEKFDK